MLPISGARDAISRARCRMRKCSPVNASTFTSLVARSDSFIYFPSPGANPPAAPLPLISFDVKNEDYEESGPLKVGIANGTYKYNVKDPSKNPPNDITDDPDVDVE